MNIITVIGARPQFIKAAVLSRYLLNNPQLNINETLVHTGQHYDNNMSEVFFNEMQIPSPHINLHVGSGTHGKMTGAMLSSIESLCIERKPDALLVYGDTNSTLAGALAASKLLIPVLHVEAGLRSFMMSMPEEQNRLLTDHLSTYLFCPTVTAMNNLKNEGITNTYLKTPSADNKRVTTTGDIMFDASLYYRKINPVKIKENDYILLTIHRQENTDNITNLKNIINAINALDKEKFIFPIHPRTKKIMNNAGLSFNSNVKLLEPVGYFEMMAYEENCKCIVTDSGGVQKEAYFFKKPCITLRDTTEWIELVNAGWNTLTGSNTDKIIDSITNLHTPSTYESLYGNGDCAKLICETILA